MTRKPTNTSRRGVALVVTLGLLAVLILMAVAFAISMRVERIAARNYADVVQARQWAQSALSRAIADAETQIGNQVMMPASANNVLINTAGATAINPALFSGAVTNYLPSSLHTSISNKPARWQNVSESHPGGGPVARIAYQIVDCTGFIDANLGNSIVYPNNRRIATNAMDMVFDTSVTTDVTDTNFPTRLIDWRPLTSLADFWVLAGPSGANALNKTDNFFTYSRFPPGYAANANLVATNALFLGHTQQYWDANKADIREKIKSQLQAMGAGIPDAVTLAANIVDYCDSDDVPELNVRDNFSTEATPLVNEILLDITTRSAGSGLFRIECTPRIELWYPFVGYTNKGAYEAFVRVEFGGDPNYVFGVSSASVTLPAPGGDWTYNDYKTHDYVFIQQAATATAPPDKDKLYVDISAVIRVAPGSSIVDFVLRRRVYLKNFNNVIDAPNTAGLMIDDPRFNSVAYNGGSNWVETGSAVSSARTPTMGAVNTGVISHDSGVDSDFKSSGLAAPWIYWPNRVLQTTGELGLQAYNPTNAWHTIPLLGTTAAQMPILDRFYVRTNTHGIVNINTWRTNVLQTVFNGCPKNGYPGESAAAGLTPAEAGFIANAIFARTSAAPLKNMSEIYPVSETIGTLNRLQSEGVIRDTAEILGVRQNLFTILFAAQSLSDTGNVLGEQRGIAVVWRDPYADSSGYHPSFVRYLRWLPD